MKQVFIRIIQAAFFFVLFYITVVFAVASTTAFTPYFEDLVFVNPTKLGNTYDRIRGLDTWLQKKDTGKTALMLGSSSIFVNVNPNIMTRKTGVDFYIAANYAQPLYNSLEILKYCLRTEKKIDYVVLGIDHAVWSEKGLESAIDWAVNDYNPARKHDLAMLTHNNYYSLWRYYTYFVVKRLLPYTKEHFERNDKSVRVESKGYTCTVKNLGVDYTPPHVTSKPFIESNYRALSEAIGICKNKGIKLVLYMPKTINVAYDTAALKGIKAEILDASIAPVGVEYYYDNYHMSCDGATINTLWVADEFNKMINTGK